VYVGGEVTTPQLIPLTAGMTVLQSVFRAEGFTDTAHPGSVIVIRKDAENRPFGIKVDLNRVMKGKEEARDIELLPYDIIYVPKKAIAKVNIWVDQYIRRNIPVQTGFGFTYELNP
jgi:protein involved in polysaccharide export with SLBB domain